MLIGVGLCTCVQSVRASLVSKLYCILLKKDLIVHIVLGDVTHLQGNINSLGPLEYKVNC